MFINKFIDIGFVEFSRTHPGRGWAVEYKYYPEYLAPNHYTLIVFSVGWKQSDVDYNKADYRLYIHDAENKFVDALFQTSYTSNWNKNYLNEEFKRIFKPELREAIINELILK